MKALLEAREISKTFVSRAGRFSSKRELVRALDRVGVKVFPGEHLSLVGGSGCGKTTLAKVIMGLVRPEAGKIYFQGDEVGQSEQGLRLFRQKARMVFQDPFASLDPRFSVRGILKEALCLEAKSLRAASEGKMRDVLQKVELEGDILSRYPHEFSGGERQRIAIARALMTNPSLLILDEAVSSVDVLVQKSILDSLLRLKERMDITYIFISHNLRLVRKISHKIAVMYGGRIVEYGTVADIFESPAHWYTKQLLQAALEYKYGSSGSLKVPEAASLKDIGGGHLLLTEE